MKWGCSDQCLEIAIIVSKSSLLCRHLCCSNLRCLDLCCCSGSVIASGWQLRRELRRSGECLKIIGAYLFARVVGYLPSGVSVLSSAKRHMDLVL
jgi:hypothetical protein